MRLMPLRSWKPRRKKREREAQPAPGLQAPTPEERESGAQTSSGAPLPGPAPEVAPSVLLSDPRPAQPAVQLAPGFPLTPEPRTWSAGPAPSCDGDRLVPPTRGPPRTRRRSFVYCHTQSAVTRGKNARLMTIESYLRLAELSAGEERSREGARDIEGFSWEARS